ncbi:uncharacterized protein LOC134221014 isoform X2 [Armigeres subalbatus]|uniref:uncharacterized protein LOC134221014 isoform X2 n=1 Tax=Armigeres subalbatus TaxID=124917 RepID=UPI002ED6B775
MEIENLEKMTPLSELQAELVDLHTKMQSFVEDIGRDAQVEANARVESNCKDLFAELEYKKVWEESLPHLVNPDRLGENSLPQELVDLYRKERELQRVMTGHRDAIQQMLNETVNTRWADIDSARRRATALRQQYLQKRAEEERIRVSIQQDRENVAKRMDKLMKLLDEMKQRKIRQDAKQVELKQESKRLDDELDRLVKELNALKTVT